MTETSLLIEETLLQQLDALAQQYDFARDQVVEWALRAFVADHALPDGSRDQRAIDQGDIFWVDLADSGIPHPHVVIQDDAINHSRVDTVVICALTSAQKRASLPGNVQLDAGEANLPKQSVVEVSKVSSIKKIRLGDYIGTLSAQRVQQILAGMRFVQTSYFAR